MFTSSQTLCSHSQTFVQPLSSTCCHLYQFVFRILHRSYTVFYKHVDSKQFLNINSQLLVQLISCSFVVAAIVMSYYFATNRSPFCRPLVNSASKYRSQSNPLLAHGRWFSPGTPASSTTKIGRHDIAEILLKVALNTTKQQTYKQTILYHLQHISDIVVNSLQPFADNHFDFNIPRVKANKSINLKP